MARRKQGEHANHERWLVSYADFITLLFAFFVMMYAHSQTDKKQAAMISQAFRDAAKEGRISSAVSRLLKNEPASRQLEREPAKPEMMSGSGGHEEGVELLPSLRQLNATLRKEIEGGRLEVRMEKRGLVISLREATFFPSGTDTVEPSTMPVLEAIAAEVKKHPNPIRLEGHTDSVPIHTARFRSNWELSAARGISMLDLFEGRFGVERSRMAIAGFADTAPVASNEDEEGRRRNRRVDIVVLNELAARQEPEQRGAGGGR